MHRRGGEGKGENRRLAQRRLNPLAARNADSPYVQENADVSANVVDRRPRVLL